MTFSINRLDKESVYTYYSVIVDDPMAYERITKKKMVLEMTKKFINNPDYMLEFIDYDDLVYYQDGGICNIEFLQPLNCFLFDDASEKRLNPILKDYILGLDVNAGVKERMNYSKLIYGMVEAYGDISFEEAEEIYQKIRPSIYQSYPMPTVDSFKKLRDLAYIDGYNVFTNWIIHTNFDYDEKSVLDHSNKHIYSYDEYLEIVSYHIPRESHPTIDDKQWENFTDNRIFSYINFSYINDFEDPYYLFRGEGVFEKECKDSGLDSVIANYVPVWRFGGRSNYILAQEEKLSCIDPEKNADLYTFINDYVYCANYKFRFHKGIADKKALFRRINSQDAYEIMNKTLVHSDFIEEFIQKKEYYMSQYIDEFIQGFKNVQMVTLGYAYQYENGLLLVYIDKKVYKVKGLSQGLQEILPNTSLPCFIDINLLPLENEITYLQSFAEYPISVGKGMIDRFEEEIMDARIISSIDDLITRN